jgi:hypothetical protein|tara:strand:+ start:155 stop:448 length:294 start_codon:yes stop_codon:yes gene_type:complete
MVISDTNKEFLDNLIEYYVSEAKSYKEIAQEYDQIIKSTSDTAFGIIIGCIYSSFLQTYSDQKQTPNEQDIEEFNQIMMENAIRIKNALQEENSGSE